MHTLLCYSYTGNNDKVVATNLNFDFYETLLLCIKMYPNEVLFVIGTGTRTGTSVIIQITNTVENAMGVRP